MESLIQLQELLNSQFIRIGFVIVISIYFLSLIRFLSSRIALLAFKILILINLLLKWIIVIGAYFNSNLDFYLNRINGSYGSIYIFMFLGSMVIPFVVLIPRWGRNVWVLFVVCLLSNIGYWMERLTINVVSIHRDYLPEKHSSNIDIFPDFHFLEIAQSLFIAIIFVIIGTWMEKNRLKKSKHNIV